MFQCKIQACLFKTSNRKLYISCTVFQAHQPGTREPFFNRGQGQKSPVRHKRGINFLTPISNFRGSWSGLPAPLHFFLSCQKICVHARTSVTRWISSVSAAVDHVPIFVTCWPNLSMMFLLGIVFLLDISNAKCMSSVFSVHVFAAFLKTWENTGFQNLLSWLHYKFGTGFMVMLKVWCSYLTVCLDRFLPQLNRRCHWWSQFQVRWNLSQFQYVIF